MVLIAILAVVAVGFAIAAVLSARKAGWLREATPVDIATAPASTGRLVRLAGTVGAGPSGTVVGPMSQREAAWWSMKVEEEWLEQQQNSQGRSNRRRRRRTLEDNQSSEPFTIADAQQPSAAPVLVDGHAVDVDNAVETVHKRDRGSLLGNINISAGGLNIGGGSGTTYIQREWALPVGTSVEAVGTVEQQPDGSARLIDGERGKLVVTTRRIDDLVRRSRMLSVLFAVLAALGVAGAIVAAVVA